MIKKFFGENLLLQNEAVVDLAKQQAAKIEDNYEDYAQELILEKQERKNEDIPPEIARELLQKMHKRHYTVFLDDKIPALDNMTPREAASAPQMRHSF